MAMDMRALYYVALMLQQEQGQDKQRYEESVKSNENFLNQNFSIIANKIYDLEARLLTLENP